MLKGLIAGLTLIVLVLAVTLPNTVGHWRESKMRFELKLAEIEALKAQCAQISQEIKALKEDPIAQEMALRKLGYVKNGERVYVILNRGEFEALRQNKSKTDLHPLLKGASARLKKEGKLRGF